MKTIATLLMSCLLLAGTTNPVLAGEESRSNTRSGQRGEVKIKREETTERRSDGDRGETRTTQRRTEIQIPSRRPQADIRISTTETRRERGERDERSDRAFSRNENRREANPSYRQPISARRSNVERRPNMSYHERHQPCAFCTGRGFTLHIDGFRHLRCNHCEGRGFRIIREMMVDACAVCYNPLHGELNCSIEELAWMETDRIALALELSSRQRERVFEINLRYLSHHYRGDYYPVSKRDREIRRILRVGQIIAFAVLLDELRSGDLCYDCTSERY